MTSRKIATSTLWQLGSQAVTMLLGILSIKFVTTALSQSLVGNYQTVYAYLQIFGILADFGLYAVSVRELSRAKDPSVTLGSLFILRAIITLISLGSAILIAWALPTFSGTPLPLGISIAVFVPFFTLLSGMLRTVFQVNYKMHFIFAVEVCSKFVPVCLMGIAIFLGTRQSENLDLYHTFLAFGGIGSFTLFILSICFAIRLLPVRPRFTKPELVRLLRMASPYGFAFFAITIYRQSDVSLIAVLRPEDYDIQNAYYGTVLRFAEIGFLLPTFILNSALPIMSKRQESGEDISGFLGTLLLGLLTLGSVISLFAFLWARPIVLLVTRSAYLSTPLAPGSDTALMLLSFSIFLGMIVSFCFYVLLNRYSWRSLLIITMAGAAFSVVSNLMLIPYFGFIGAGITSITTHLLLASGLLVVCLRKVRITLPFPKLCQWFAYSLTLGLALFAMAPLASNSVRTVLFGALMLVISGVLLRVFGLLHPAMVPGGSR